MNSWFPQIAAIFTQNKQKPKADKLQHFYNSASSLLSIQVNDLTHKRINGLTKSLMDAISTNVLCDIPIRFVFQLRSLMTRSILSYVEIFTDPRKLPRIEMELILRGSEICFSPSISEVSEMILSVVAEVSLLDTILNTFSRYSQVTMTWE